MANSERKRGRPPTFESETRKTLAVLIRQHGARQAKELASVPVSVATRLKIAREHGIIFKKGRRPKQAS